MNRSRYVQMGVVLSPAVAARLKQQLREKAARESRSLSFSKAVREALDLYGLDLREPGAVTTATLAAADQCDPLNNTAV